jgi:iron(III) transport system ATP-binding protein
MNAIEVDKLVVRRHSGFVLGPMSFALPVGSRTALVGPSGCGKSTLLRCLAGLQKAHGGTIRMSDRIVTNGRILVPPDRRRIGFVFQDGALWPHLSAVQHLRFANPRLTKRSAGDLLARVRLEGRDNTRPGELSGGEAQRLALARALAGDPEFLLLDEPLSSIDAELRGTLAEMIHREAEARALTLLMVTHNIEEAVAVADRVLTMRGGRLQDSAGQ